MKNLFFFSLIFILIFSGCVPKPLPIDVPQAESKVVVFNQLFQPQGWEKGVLTLALTRSFSALAPDTLAYENIGELLVGNALVTISYQGQTRNLISPTSGVYLLDLDLVPNEEYTLKIITQDGQIVNAKTKLYPKIALAAVNTEQKIVSGDTLHEVVLDIQDDLSAQNWYEIQYFSKLDSSSTDSTLQVGLQSYFGGGATVAMGWDIVSDAELSTGITKYRKDLEEMGFQAGDSIAISFTNVSQEYYNYLKTRQRSQNNLLSILTKEAINYPTNVENGYGFFTLHNPDVRKAVVK